MWERVISISLITNQNDKDLQYRWLCDMCCILTPFKSDKWHCRYAFHTLCCTFKTTLCRLIFSYWLLTFSWCFYDKHILQAIVNKRILLCVRKTSKIVNEKLRQQSILLLRRYTHAPCSIHIFLCSISSDNY